MPDNLKNHIHVFLLIFSIAWFSSCSQSADTKQPIASTSALQTSAANHNLTTASIDSIFFFSDEVIVSNLLEMLNGQGQEDYNSS